MFVAVKDAWQNIVCVFLLQVCSRAMVHVVVHLCWKLSSSAMHCLDFHVCWVVFLSYVQTL